MNITEENLLNAVKESMMQQIKSTNFISVPYNNKKELPPSFMEKAWALIDQDALLAKLAVRLENELVDRLVNSLAAEVATDIKQVLSVKERREAVRSVVRDNIDILTKGVSTKP